jgi:hypothetical protein
LYPVVVGEVLATHVSETEALLAADIVREKVAVAVSAVGVEESVTLKVTDAAPIAADGVPLIAPVLGFSVSPVGRVPELIDQLNWLVPPVATNVCE